MRKARYARGEMVVRVKTENLKEGPTCSLLRAIPRHALCP
jgi:hypothetical protein